MKKRCMPILLIVLFLLISTGCAGRPEPDQAAKTFLERLENGEYDKMYEQLTLEQKAKISQESFRTNYTKIYDTIGMEKLNLEISELANGEKREVVDNRVDLPVRGAMMTWTVGEINMDQTLKMVYEEKEWRVDWQSTNILPELPDLSHYVVISRTSGERGNIFDRNGEYLVGPGTIYRIGLVPGKMQGWEETINRLAPLIAQSPKRIEQALQQKWVRPDTFVPLRSITKAEWTEKKAELLAIPGMLASADTNRIYYSPESLSSTIGYMGEINKTELEEWRTEGYQRGDRVGRDGLEKKFEKVLAGEPGFMIRILDPAGKERSILKFTRPKKGEDITLTIDLRLQRVVEKAMGDRRGVAVALAPKTGEVLALASFPGYDANEFIFGGSSNRLSDILNDPEKPLLNRAIQGRYIPGSTFKPFTALTALEFDPSYDPARKVDLPNSTWQPEAGWGSYVVRRVPRPAGPVSLRLAMKWSDNIYFAQLAYNMGEEPLFQMAERAGFAKPIPFTLDVAQSTLATKRPIPSTILLADTGYGQGQVQMTPLHMAMIYAAIATDGKLRQPILTTDEEHGKIWLDKALASAENIKLMQDILKTTVQDEAALAHDAHIPGLNLAGKTGTAQVGNDKEVGWFISFHPADDPAMVLLVGIEEAVRGSHDAIDVTRDILMEYYQLNLMTGN